MNIQEIFGDGLTSDQVVDFISKSNLIKQITILDKIVIEGEEVIDKNIGILECLLADLNHPETIAIHIQDFNRQSTHIVVRDNKSLLWQFGTEQQQLF